MFKTVILVCGVNIGTHDIIINPILSSDEMHLGIIIGIDSHTDNSYVKKYSFVESIVYLMRVDAVPFDKSIGKLSDLPIVNYLYSYDKPNKFRTIILRIKHAIYIKDMKHAMLCPNQALENSTIIGDVHSRRDHTGTDTFTITARYSEFPLKKYCPTAYIHLRQPPEEDLAHCPIIDITDEEEYDPYKESLNSYAVNSTPILKLEGTIYDYEYIDDWLLFSPD